MQTEQSMSLTQTTLHGISIVLISIEVIIALIALWIQIQRGKRGRGLTIPGSGFNR